MILVNTILHSVNASENEGSDNMPNCSQEVIQHFKEVYQVEQWKTDGFFEDEDLLDIPCHWLGFKPARPSLHFILSITYTFVFLVGFLSNISSIYIVVSSKKLLTPANILLTNLAISDILTVLMVPVFVFNSFHQGPAIGQLGCTFYGFLTGLSGTCSIMTLSAVAVERYLVISRPLNIGGKPTRRWAYYMSLSAWLYSAGFACLPFFGVGKYVPEGYLTGCSFDYLSNDLKSKMFILVFFFGAWMIPMIISVYCYVYIIRAVVHVRRDVVTHSPGTLPSASNNHQRNSFGINQPNVEVKVAKIVMGLIGAWTVSWTPYAIVALIGISGYGHLLTPLGAMIPSLFAKSSTCINPFLYTLTQPRIRKEIFRRLGVLPPRTNSSAGGGTSRPNPGLSRYHENNSHRTITGWRPTTPRSTIIYRVIEGNNYDGSNLIQLNDIRDNRVIADEIEGYAETLV